MCKHTKVHDGRAYHATACDAGKPPSVKLADEEGHLTPASPCTGTRPVSTSDPPMPAAASTRTGGDPPYNWAKAWYPMIPIEDLLLDRPQVMHLLGTQMAVWMDAPGHWSAVQDRCPHR